MRRLRRALHKMLKKYGYQVSRFYEKPPHAMDYVQEARGAMEIVKDYTMLSFLKLSTLYEQVVYCEKTRLEGAYVECGVWKGGAVGIMALANLKHGLKRRPIHLLDSFDDICEPDPVIDGRVAVSDMERLAGKKIENLKGRLEPIKGVYDSRGGHGTIETCKELIVDKIKYDEEWLFFHKGWFQDSLPKFSKEVEKIAILRLDADWYSSTSVCLEYLFDKVVQGGFIIIDDYGRYDGCKKAVDEFLAKRNLSPFLNYSDYLVGECRYFIKS
jgi:O-methyltransferase